MATKVTIVLSEIEYQQLWQWAKDEDRDPKGQARHILISALKARKKELEPAQPNLEILELRREVMRQWVFNHAEHCGARIPPWPHAGDCHWPVPPVILAASPNEVYLLLLEVSGVD